MVSKIHKTGGNEIISLDLENFKVDMLEIKNSSLIDFHFPKRKFTFNLKMMSPLVHKKCKSILYSKRPDIYPDYPKSGYHVT